MIRFIYNWLSSIQYGISISDAQVKTFIRVEGEYDDEEEDKYEKEISLKKEMKEEENKNKKVLFYSGV